MLASRRSVWSLIESMQRFRSSMQIRIHGQSVLPALASFLFCISGISAAISPSNAAAACACAP